MTSASSSDDDDEFNETEERLYFTLCADDSVGLKRLLEEGFNVNTKFEGSNQLGKSALHLCCEKGHYDCAKMLLDRGAKPHIQDGWIQTPLMYCISTERENMAQLMVDYGCDVNLKDRFGKTALHYSINNTDTKCVEVLLKGGAKVDDRDDHGRTPLWTAVMEDGHESIIKLLLEAGSKVNSVDIRESRTALQAAIMFAKKDCLKYVKMLIEAGGSPNTMDRFCYTCFISLIRRGIKDGEVVSPDEVEVAQCLLDAGFDVNIVSLGKYWFQFRGTALKMAVDRGVVPYVKMLLDAGANPDLHDDKLVTPLLVAAYYNRLKIGRMLLKANCQMDIIGQMKVNNVFTPLTPFKCAILQEHWEFAELMLMCGYDLRSEHYLFVNEEVPEQLVLNFDFWGMLMERLFTPWPLSLQCRRYFRQTLGFGIGDKVDKLQLPKRIRDFLLLEDVLGPDI